MGKSEAKIYQQCSFCFRFVLLLVLYSEPEIGRKEEMQSGKRHTTIFPLVPGREYKTGPTTARENVPILGPTLEKEGETNEPGRETRIMDFI